MKIVRCVELPTPKTGSSFHQSDISVFSNFTVNDLRGSLVKLPFSELNSKGFTPKEVFYTESRARVFRGLHLQWGKHSTQKVTRLIHGEITQYFLDLRQDSDTFLTLFFIKHRAESGPTILIPKGIANGYLVNSTNATILYLTDDVFCKACDKGVNLVSIKEFLDSGVDPIISERDLNLPNLEDFVQDNKNIPC